MDKTNSGNITPGGKPDSLVNPPYSEDGPADSGGRQLLLDINPFKRSTLVLRSPTQSGESGAVESARCSEEGNGQLWAKLGELEVICLQLRKEMSVLRAENEELKTAVKEGSGTLRQERSATVMPAVSRELTKTLEGDEGRTAVLKTKIAEAEKIEEEQLRACACWFHAYGSMEIKKGLTALE